MFQVNHENVRAAVLVILNASLFANFVYIFVANITGLSLYPFTSKLAYPQLALTFSKSTMKKPEQCDKSVYI